MKSFYNHFREAMKQKAEKAPEEWRELLTRWRRTNAIVRTQKPFRLDRARILGYRAKTGFILVRVRLLRGGRKRPRRRAGRRSKRQTSRKTLMMNYQWVAETRVQRKYPNMEVLNSYYLAKDGLYYWFEVILVDPSAPEIKSDKILRGFISYKNRKRALRGLTSAAHKSRGLR